jgi:hypothetical protein
MRGTFVVVIGMAAGFPIAACSSSGSSALPGASQATASAARSALRLVAVGAAPDASCPSQFLECVTVTKKTPAQFSICAEETGTCPAPGVWTWSETIETAAGKPVKKIVGNISPNPGNPITDTVSENKRVKSSKQTAKYQQLIEACDSSSDCIQGAIGIITK